MNSIREIVGTLFRAPMQQMSFISFFQYANESGKITSRSLLDLCIVLLVQAEEQERLNAKYEDDFNHIETILKKLVDEKFESLKKEDIIDKPLDVEAFIKPQEDDYKCGVCEKSFKSNIALMGHSRTHKVISK